MRTPGYDAELVVGFLFTEGIISSYENIKDVYHSEMCASQKENIVIVELAEHFTPTTEPIRQKFLYNKTVGPFQHTDKLLLALSAHTFYELPQKLSEAQSTFSATGGIHASVLFSVRGRLLLLHEDVGRHNVLDKLIGAALKDNLLPLNQHILLLSGRASFELVQKAAMAGISVVAAIGAPSILAVELAQEFNMALLFFLKEDRFNIYNKSKRHKKGRNGAG